MAQLEKKSLTLLSDGELRLPWKDKTEAQVQNLLKLQYVSDKRPKGQYVGALLSFPVADGSAYYRVTKTRPLTLQHIDFLDGYQIPYAHVRGLRVADIKRRLEWEEGLKELLK